MAARATYIAGFNGTSTFLAGQRFEIPIYGTMAHSFVQAHDDEMAAFARFADANPGNVVLLIDTYNTEAGAEKVARLAPQLRERGIGVQAVRIDSGDLGSHARKVRQIRDNGGLSDAPIDGFGVGTRLDTSSDAPYLDCAYKLQEYGGRACRKRSEGKTTWPGRKQVYRTFDGAGCMAGDILALHDDRQEGEPLLHPVMRDGKRLDAPMLLSTLRERTSGQLERLPEPLRTLDQAKKPFEVKISDALRLLALAVDERSR